MTRADPRLLLTALLWACAPASPGPGAAGVGHDPVDSADTAAGLDTATPTTCTPSLPARRSYDADAAARGQALFVDGTLGEPMVPTVALRNLWAVWGGGPILDDDAYWEAFRDRYGLVEAPWPNDDLPLGLHPSGAGTATVDCLLCHADQVAGEVVIGVGNSRLDLQALWDDLVALQAVGESLGLPPVELPYELVDTTAAAGSVDGVGLGMQMSLAYGPPGADIETHFGAQQAAPWWTLPYKDHVYSDGTGDVANHRSMASTLLAFGTPWTTLQSLDPTLLDLQAMMATTTPPPWPFAVDEALAAEGLTVYQSACAACHGDLCDPAVGFPDRVVPADEVGTDPTRAERWTEAEAAWANISWFGEPGPMRDTDGYQANPLIGVWASAPYLHNGSVPDLASLLDPARRPEVWQRTGATGDDYDPDTVGWSYDVVAAPATRDTVDDRRVVDTTQPAMANTGHVYGEALTADERSALLEFLKTL